MADSRFRAFMNGNDATTGEVHWGAVGAGVIVALVGQMLLTLLGAGLGASYGVAEGESVRGETIAWGAYAWWVVTGLASAFAGGWTAGWVAGSAPSIDRIEGSFQGFLAWGTAALIITIVVLGLAGGSALAARLGGPLAYEMTAPLLGDAATPQPADRETASGTAAQLALWSFFALVAGAGLAMLGGYLGVGHARHTIATGPAVRPTPRAVGS